MTKLICIKSVIVRHDINDNIIKQVIKGNIYYMKQQYPSSSNSFFAYDENEKYCGYYSRSLFMTLDEYRNKQINTLLK